MGVIDKTIKVLIITDDKKLQQVSKLCFDNWGYEVFFKSALKPDIDGVVKISPDIIIVDVCSAAIEGFRICDSLKKNFATAYIPIITLITKHQLKEHILDYKQHIDDYMIKPPDPLEFRLRIDMAVKKAQHSFYANPLTGLPGSIVIEETLKERLGSRNHFVTGHVDIDHFKSFNDKYGYLKGDRVIMQTAYMLRTAVKTWGNRNDFIGHIGGDDFVLITTPNRYNDICKNLICMFDTVIPFHYCAGDRRQGYILAKDRTNRLKKIPIMSVTIALVMKNSPAEVKSIIELNDRIAEVKQYLKKIPGSKYMADRRIMKKSDHLTVQVFSNDRSVIESYKPLGQILIERNIITQDQLDKALKVHWKRGVLLGRVLKDLGFITDRKLSEALHLQEHPLQ